MERKEEGLKALGNRAAYTQSYDFTVLETFENQHPGNDH